jgi:O-methyltransferase involved in polyketide biosynthesis
MRSDLNGEGMKEFKNEFESLRGIAKTSLFPLYLRAIESQRHDAIIKDDRAVALIRQIHYDFSRFKFDEDDSAILSLRNQEFDRLIRYFLLRCPEAVVVHVGCGLDTRFERVDNGKIEWYDLDLPEVIELRRRLIGGEGERYHFLSCSVFDTEWPERLSVHSRNPFLFVAEGVLQYFEETRVKSLVLMLQQRFPNSELICDAITAYVAATTNVKHESAKMPLVKWEIKCSTDLEGWSSGIKLRACH